MADRRPDLEGNARSKRQNTSSENDVDPKSNPYLAHWNDEAANNGYSNGYASRNGTGGSTPLSRFKKHKSTARAAMAAEDGPQNPFNGNQLSQQYFGILKIRRDLPVHTQRYVSNRTKNQRRRD
jgi:pre-mRNA-splicing factor ATP-dependent RNA helicase DHX15/PRP43